MDQIVKMIATDAPVKAIAITGKDLVERARTIHTLLPVATAALGRSLLGAAMMGSQLKGEGESLTLQIRGGGPLGTITVVSDSSGNVRGYLQNGEVDLPLKGPAKLDVGTAVGRDGTLTVIRDMGLKDPYIGTVPLISGEIAEDLTAYFSESEQTPCACALGVLVDVDQSVQTAGGFLISLMPGAGQEEAEKIERGVASISSVSHFLRDGNTPRALLEQILSEFSLVLLEESPVEYRCPCSRERVVRALISMGGEELGAMIEEDHGAELTCQFCDKVYSFTELDLKEIYDEL